MIFLFKNNLFLFFLARLGCLIILVDFFVLDRWLFIFNFYFFNRINFTFPIILDFYRVLFALAVIFISSNIIKFSTFYLRDELFKTRFLLILLLFISSMLFLIFVPNLVFLIVGWDGLGLSSFYLIIYYQNQRSLGASMITLLSNRVGDLCLLIAIGLFISLGTRFLPHITLLRLLILTACFTKRAQFPFIRWLPAAMAAPTPVSALVHSSTLVTAGVYLIIRFFRPIFEAERARFIIATISRITMFFSALRGIFETDFKKIIALSTLRQLGFIIFRISQGIKICGFFHLITHAIFKSLLFICAGAVIILRGHNQDIRRLPKFNNLIIQRCFIVASIALIRTPFLVGFYSKDLILEMLFQNQTKNWILVVIVFLRSWLTVAYSVRIIYLSRWQRTNFNFSMNFNFKEILPIYKAVLFSASISILAGARLSWLFRFETKAIIPTVLSREMTFICSFILMGSLTFVIFSNLPRVKMFLHMFFLTPIFQKSPEPIFKFSKTLYHFSDLAWLEKVSYVELKALSFGSSSLSYLVIKNIPLIKQLVRICFVLVLLRCL